MYKVKVVRDGHEGFVFLALSALLIALTLAQLASADGCLTRDEAITLIAHKTYAAGVPALKWRIWAIADRESGMQHCGGNGRTKMSVTNDHGLLQLNERGVWLNCAVNPRCKEPGAIDDAEYQVDVMISYYRKYGDLCPWNPDPAGNYAPGCGYR
jgi:hypothetical protein